MSSSENNNIIPKSLIVDNYFYTFKDYLNNDFYSYRCKFRGKCKIVIKISREEIIKYNNAKENNTECQINFSISSSIKTHSCDDAKKDNLLISSQNNINKIQNNRELAKNLIYANIDKSLSYHM